MILLRIKSRKNRDECLMVVPDDYDPDQPLNLALGIIESPFIAESFSLHNTLDLKLDPYRPYFSREGQATPFVHVLMSISDEACEQYLIKTGCVLTGERVSLCLDVRSLSAEGRGFLVKVASRFAGEIILYRPGEEYSERLWKAPFVPTTPDEWADLFSRYSADKAKANQAKLNDKLASLREMAAGLRKLPISKSDVRLRDKFEGLTGYEEAVALADQVEQLIDRRNKARAAKRRTGGAPKGDK